LKRLRLREPLGEKLIEELCATERGTRGQTIDVKTRAREGPSDRIRGRHPIACKSRARGWAREITLREITFGYRLRAASALKQTTEKIPAKDSSTNAKCDRNRRLDDVSSDAPDLSAHLAGDPADATEKTQRYDLLAPPRTQGRRPAPFVGNGPKGVVGAGGSPVVIAAAASPAVGPEVLSDRR